MTEDLPPAALAVRATLREADGALTHDDLRDQLDIADRTLSWALRRLDDRDAIETRPLPEDGRREEIRLSPATTETG